MIIGVLALQGAFREHIQMIQQLGVDTREIRQPHDMEGIDGLIIPGGESTVMGKLLHSTGLYQPLKSKIDAGLPVMGTCAGLILLASKIEDDPTTHLATLPVTVKRNAYGRQLDSFQANVPVDGIGTFPMVFIRAPYIASIDDNAETKVLAVHNDRIVAVRWHNQLGISFHPELTNDTRFHEYFLKIITRVHPHVSFYKK